MGKPKGKRAHRKIDVGEDAYIEKKREDAAAGGAVDELPDDSLFFVDNDGGIAAGGGMAMPTSRKAKARAKTLRVDAILTKAKTAKPFAVPVPRGVKGPPTKAFNTKGAELAKTSKAELARRAAAGKRTSGKLVAKSASGGEKIAGEALFKPARRFTLDDVLGDDPDAPEALNAYDLWGGGVDPKRQPVQAKTAALRKAGALAADAAAYSKHRLGDAPKPSAKRLTPYRPSTSARAVQVDGAGCSYNPRGRAAGRHRRGGWRADQEEAQGPARPGARAREQQRGGMRMSEELFTAQDELYDEGDEDEAFGANNAAVTRDGKMTIAQRRGARAREAAPRRRRTGWRSASGGTSPT